MNRFRFSLRTLVLAALLAGALMGILAPLIIPFLSPWSRINCEVHEINVRTGQTRFSRYLWHTKVSERVADTPVSLCLHGEQVVADAAFEPWHIVNTLSFAMRNSPHYAFHGALYQANEFENCCERYALNNATRKTIAREILTRWQKGRNDSAVEEYFRELYAEFFKWQDGTR